MALSDRILAAQRDRSQVISSTDESDRVPSNGRPRTRTLRDPFGELKRAVHAQLVQALGPQLYDVNMTQSDLEQQVRAALQTAVASTNQPMSGTDRTRVI